MECIASIAQASITHKKNQSVRESRKRKCPHRSLGRAFRFDLSRNNRTRNNRTRNKNTSLRKLRRKRFAGRRVS